MFCMVLVHIGWCCPLPRCPWGY